MKLRLTETQMKSLEEKLGVPDNLINIATKILPVVEKKINLLTPESFKQEKVEGSDGFTNQISITGNLNLNEKEIKKINIELQLIVDRGTYFGFNKQIDLLSMGYVGKSRIEGINIVHQKNQKQINLRIVFIVENGWTPDRKDVIIEYLRNNRSQIVSNLGHELKHAYDNMMQPTMNIGKRATYSAHADPPGSGILTIQKFIHMLYYLDRIESLVRPSEVATRMVYGGVNFQNFKRFLFGDTTYKELKRYRDFTYEQFYTNLKNDMNQIDKLLKHVGDYSAFMDEDTKIDKILTIVYVSLSNYKLQIIKDIVVPQDFLSMLLGKMSDEEKQFLNKYRNQVAKFHDNPKEFYKTEIIKSNREALRMTKKLSKLYAYLY